MLQDDRVPDHEHSSFFMIGNLVESVGMEPKTVRFYERAGLIKPRRVGNFRVYNDRDIELLKVIKFLRSLDMSIRIIKDLLDRHSSLRMDNLPSEAKTVIEAQLKKREAEYEKLLKLCQPILDYAPETPVND